MKKIIRLTERDLTRIIKRTIKEIYDGDDDKSNELYDEYSDTIEQMMYEFQGTEDCKELWKLLNSANKLYGEIETSKELRYTEKNELLDSIDELSYEIEDIINNDCRDDYKHGMEYNY